MNLKLAEYKDGKFERFLELGRILGYSGESDNLFSYAGNSISIMDAVCGYCEKEEVVYATIETREFLKDKKDPLNRFNGLFNGRTYGEGRFVLIIDDQDTRREYFPITYDASGRRKVNIHIDPTSLNASFNPEISEIKMLRGDFRFLGNLHENPELFEQIN